MIFELRFIIWSALLATLIISLFFRIRSFLSKYNGLPKSNECGFIFGDAYQLIKSYFGLTENTVMETLIQLCKNYFSKYRDSKVITLWLSWKPFVFVFEASYAEKILTSQEAIEKSMEYDNLHSWLGTGLLTSAGQKWHIRRRMLSPAFHFRILQDQFLVFNQECTVLIDKLNKLDGQEVDVFDIIPYAALDTICEAAMGVNMQSQTNPKSKYVCAVLSQSELTFSKFISPPIPQWIYNLSPSGRLSKQNLKILHQFTENIIYKKIKERSQKDFDRGYKLDKNESDSVNNFNVYVGKSGKRLAFIDLLVDHYIDQEKYPQEQKLSIKDIQEEVSTFMFEGFDTTAAAISWTIYLLAHNPENQKKLFQELSFLGLDEDIDCEKIKTLKFTEACIKEALRLFPSVPFIGRKLCKPMKIQDYVFPSDTSILINIFELHRDSRFFPEPEEFRPNRFLEYENRNVYAFLPFSAGYRNCIGQKFAMAETISVVARVFRNFKVRATRPFEELKFAVELITRPKSPLAVIFEKRKN